MQTYIAYARDFTPVPMLPMTNADEISAHANFEYKLIDNYNSSKKFFLLLKYQKQTCKLRIIPNFILKFAKIWQMLLRKVFAKILSLTHRLVDGFKYPTPNNLLKIINLQYKTWNNIISKFFINILISKHSL